MVGGSVRDVWAAACDNTTQTAAHWAADWQGKGVRRWRVGRTSRSQSGLGQRFQALPAKPCTVAEVGLLSPFRACHLSSPGPLQGVSAEAGPAKVALAGALPVPLSKGARSRSFFPEPLPAAILCCDFIN